MKLLLAIDDSPFSDAAAKAVISHYSPQGMVVRILNVADEALPTRETLNRAHQLVNRIAELLRQSGFTVQTVVEEGEPRMEIVNQAERWKADLIVLGSHGRSGTARFLMGSVAEAVAQHAPCSVKIIRIAPASADRVDGCHSLIARKPNIQRPCDQP
jgi:nucleotide-binding universal stress UspA family protein